MFPQILKTAAPPIPFHLIRQQPGICVATCPGAYHMVINAGSNTAKAINFTDSEFTERFCNKPSRCNCIQRKAIDLTRSKHVEDENFASLNFNRTSDGRETEYAHHHPCFKKVFVKKKGTSKLLHHRIQKNERLKNHNKVELILVLVTYVENNTCKYMKENLSRCRC